MSDPIKEILAEHVEMQHRRAGHEATWREIATYCSPAREMWQGATLHRTEGRDGTLKIASSTGMAATREFASALEGTLMPRMHRWHSLTGASGGGKSGGRRGAMDKMRDKLFEFRNSEDSGFSTARSETFLQIALFGQAPLFVRAKAGVIRYSAIPLPELYISTDDIGRPDKIHREFSLTKRAALQAWPDAPWPAWVTSDSLKPEHGLQFLHVVKPISEMPADFQKRVVSTSKGEFRFGSLYILKGAAPSHGTGGGDGPRIIDTGRYLEMPYVFARIGVVPGEIYARGLCEASIPDIRTEAALIDALLKTANWESRPAILGSGHDLAGINKRLIPGSYIPGGVDPSGKPRFLPFSPQVSAPAVTAEMAREFTERIRRNFYLHLLSTTPERPNQTATEYLGRQAEIITLMGAPLGRLFDELIKPMVKAEIAALVDLGVEGFDSEAREAGVEHEGRFARLHRMADLESALQWLGGVAQLAGLKPEEAIHAIEVGGFIDLLTEATGVPLKVRAKPDKAADDAAAEKQQQALLAQSQIAQAFSGAAKNVGLVAGAAQ